MVLQDLDSDVTQCQELMEASSGPSRDADSFSKVPKGVTSLKPVIGMLMNRVAHRVILFSSANNAQDPLKDPSAEWLSKAREMAQLICEHELRWIEKHNKLSCHLDSEMSQVEFLIWTTVNKEA